jgi:hypothetical protein
MTTEVRDLGIVIPKMRLKKVLMVSSMIQSDPQGMTHPEVSHKPQVQSNLEGVPSPFHAILGYYRAAPCQSQ